MPVRVHGVGLFAGPSPSSLCSSWGQKPPWNVSHRPHYSPLLNLWPPHRHPAPLPMERFPPAPLLPPSQSLTTTPSPCTPTPRLLSLLAVGAPPPPLTYAHTYNADDECTSTHPSPPTHVPPSFFLLPPLPLAVKVREGMPFAFCRFFICVMCVSFVAYNKYEDYSNCMQIC